MGSGFLVSAPLLVHEVGSWAPVAMAALLAIAYAVGAMIRINIRWAEPLDHTRTDGEHSRHTAHRASHAALSKLDPDSTRAVLEKLSHCVLAAAYVISVSYYLQLLSVFVLDRFAISSVTAQRALTTSLLLLIATIGTVRGLSALEKVEVYAVSLNLGMIAALLVGLCVFDTQAWLHGRLARVGLEGQDDGVHAARTLMGLLIVVQGFETSRFLGAEHPAAERVVTMRKAQWIASAVYLAFITLALPLFRTSEVAADVTAIVALVHPVAQALPALIVLAAAASQFSAAVADDAGCAGLGESLLRGRLSARGVYTVLGVVTIVLTWLTDVLSIISLASRAFALFYALQCAVTAAVSREQQHMPHNGSCLRAAWCWAFSV